MADFAAAPSRRALLGALAATPVAVIPRRSGEITPIEWLAAVETWRAAEAALAPLRRCFDAAEKRWFMARSDPSTCTALENAKRAYEHGEDCCQAALNSLLNTRSPDISALLWKLGIIMNVLGSDVPEALWFLPPDIRALQKGRSVQRGAAIPR